MEGTGPATHYRLPDCSDWNQPGAPTVPFRTVYLVIPDGQSVTGVKVTPGKVVDLGTRPAPAMGFSRPGAPQVDWNGRNPWPAATWQVGEAGWMRGTQLQPVVLRPVQWDPLSRHVRLITGFDIEVTTESAGRPPEGVLIPARHGTHADADFADVVDRLALNGSGRAAGRLAPSLRTKDSGATPFSPRFRPSVDGSAVEYVIITTDDLAPFLAPLAEWKTERGIPTVVRTLEWIRANYPNGVDLGETIRKFISDAVSRWGTEWVLLAGDADRIPVRYGSTQYYGGEKIPADMYYQCLDGNWNGDGDAIFGEGYVSSANTGDGCDLMPDVWLGRAAIIDSVTAETFVNKVLAYEKTPPPGNVARALMFAEVLFPQQYTPGDSIIFDGATIAEQALTRFPPQMAVTRLYENYPAYAGVGALPENRASVIANVNQGYGMVQHIGHGYINTMAVGDGGEALDNSDAATFTNSNMFSVLYSINCTSAAIDFNSIGEEWIRNPNGGAVANIGSTRYDFPGTGTNYQNEFYRLLFQVPVATLGEAFADSKVPFIPLSGYDSEDRWTQFSQILLGDPSLHVWSAQPETLVVTHPAGLTLGSETVNVTVTSDGLPVSAALVCLYKSDDDYETAVTDGAGHATLTFRPDRPGPANLTVTGRNMIPWQAVLPVAAPAGPHLFASGTVIDDATAPATGNGDGVFDLFETVNLELILANQGTSAATGITGTLASSDPNLTIIDANATWPDVAPGGSALPSHAFVVRGTGAATDRYETSATLTITAAGYSRSEPVVILAGAPLLERYHIAVSDTALGNGNGVIEANESQTLVLRIRNNGRGAVEGLVGKLRSLDAYTTILDSVATYGSIVSGGIGVPDRFVFRFSDTSLTHKMRFVLEVPGRTLSTYDIDVQKPAVPAMPSAGGKATSIALKWTPGTETDLRGYIILRSTSASGPFTRISNFTDSKIAYYNDENLPPLTRFYYRVVAIDQSGNQSAQSGTAAATTTLPSSPGFPILLGGTTSSSPTFSYFNGDTIPEIVCGSDEIYVISGTGVEYIDGDHDARTYGVFTQSGKANFWSPPSSTDIDRDGVIDVCSAGWSNGRLYLYDGHSTCKPGFPVNVNINNLSDPHTWSAPCLADVDGDSIAEIFINSGQHTYAFHANGTELIDGDHNPATKGVFAVLGTVNNYSTPIVADLNNDGVPEVIITSRDMKLYVKRLDGSDYPGFPVTYTGDITSTPAIGDINNDGLPEIVFGTSANQIHALNINKVEPPGWPRNANFNQDIDSSPALADVDGDGYLDVAVCAGNGTVYLIHGQNGTNFPGFPVIIYDSNGQKIAIRSSPVIGNVDTSPDLEMIFGGQDGNVYAYKSNGQPALGFPIKTDNVVEGAPMIWDLDGDGLNEVCVEGFDQRLYLWDTPARFTGTSSCPWPMFAHDSRRSGIYGKPIFQVTGVPEAPRPPARGPDLSQNWPNPFNPRTSIRFTIPAGGTTSPVTLDVFDPAGRLVRRLVDSRLAEGDHTVTWNGLNSRGEAAGSGIYFYRLTVAGRSVTRKMVLTR